MYFCSKKGGGEIFDVKLVNARNIACLPALYSFRYSQIQLRHHKHFCSLEKFWNTTILQMEVDIDLVLCDVCLIVACVYEFKVEREEFSAVVILIMAVSHVSSRVWWEQAQEMKGRQLEISWWEGVVAAPHNLTRLYSSDWLLQYVDTVRLLIFRTSKTLVSYS